LLHVVAETISTKHVNMSARLWFKMTAAGLAICVGGPALVYYVSPSEEELFERYNPELQKRSLENRQQTQQDFDNFVTKLKGWSKSDKSIWEAAAEEEARVKAAARAQTRRLQDAEAARRDEIKQQALR